MGCRQVHGSIGSLPCYGQGSFVLGHGTLLMLGLKTIVSVSDKTSTSLVWFTGPDEVWQDRAV